MFKQYIMTHSRDPVIGNPEFGVFLFGAFYLMYRGLWGHALLLILLVLPTFGIAYLWYIFKTREYLTRKYFMEGYWNHETPIYPNHR